MCVKCVWKYDLDSMSSENKLFLAQECLQSIIVQMLTDTDYDADALRLVNNARLANFEMIDALGETIQ